MAHTPDLPHFFEENINLEGLFDILSPKNNLVLADDMMLSDADGIILRVSENYERNFGFTHDSIVGKSAFDLEANGTFRPCITAEVIRQKKKITATQTINHTLSLDGDPVDVLVPTPYPLQPGSVIRCRPVGVLKMTDEAGEDAKLVAVPHSKLSKEYDHIKDVNDLPELLKAQIAHFFEHYKDLEKGKWVKVEGWENAEAAKAEIVASFERAKNK